MTIAAGFRFTDGILLCSDTEMTAGDAKLSARKIQAIDFGYENGILCFAIAGRVSYALMAVENVVRTIRKEAAFDHPSVRQIIENETLAIYREHIYTHPLYGTAESPAFDLIAAFWTYPEYLSLWRTEETAIGEVGSYECIGSGMSFARYLAEPIYKLTMNRNEIVALAIEILGATKDYVRGCGKNSDFLILNEDGMFGYVLGWDISTQEHYGKTFTSAFRKLWLKACDQSLSDESLSKETLAVSELLSQARKERKGMLMEHKRLTEELSQQIVKKMMEKPDA